MTLRPLRGPLTTPLRWAERLVGGLGEPLRAALQADPMTAVSDRLGLTVVPSDALGERGAGGWCDGLSITEEGVVFFAPTIYSKRENFTICHEVGHFLAENDTDQATLDWVADLPRRGPFVEHTCDVIASRLLLPAQTVKAVLGALGPSGDAMLLLFEKSAASRQAVAVALAERMPCPGFAAVVDLDESVVTFAGRAGDARPVPWRGDEIPKNHPLLALREAQILAVDAWWPEQGGSRHGYYMHATRRGKWAYAVFAENDLWGAVRFHAPRTQQRSVPRRVIHCPCGYDGEASGFPCAKCHQIPCPRCGECECDRAERVPRTMCQRCFITFPANQVHNGLCESCKD